MQNLSCIDDMTSMPEISREIHACEFADLLSRIPRMTVFLVIRSTSVKKWCTLLKPFTLPEMLTSRTYRGSTWSVPRLYGRLILPAVLWIQATSTCSKPIRLAWEQQWRSRKMILWSQTSSEDAREKPRPHRTNLTYMNGKRARIIRAAGNYA